MKVCMSICVWHCLWLIISCSNIQYKNMKFVLEVNKLKIQYEKPHCLEVLTKNHWNAVLTVFLRGLNFIIQSDDCCQFVIWFLSTFHIGTRQFIHQHSENIFLVFVCIWYPTMKEIFGWYANIFPKYSTV